MEEEQTKKVTTEEHASKSKSEPNSRRAFKTMGQLWLSRKLWMTLAAFALNWLAYWQEVNYLYSFTQPEQITAFIGITRDFHWVVAAGLLAYLGVTGAVEWKHGTTSIINQASSFIAQKTESKTETRTENTQRNIVEQNDPNAPALKPFGQQATRS